MKAFLSVIAGSVLGLVSGGLAGTLLAGNYATDLQFLEYRGYEAGAYWGGIAGLLLGGLLGWAVGRVFHRMLKSTGGKAV